jgi:hypothetical protein
VRFVSFADAGFKLPFPRFCGDASVAEESIKFASRLSEKSNFLLTADINVALDSTVGPRMGEDTGPKDGCLLAGDFKNVFIGDLDCGGSRILFRSAMTAVGSGTVPDEMLEIMLKSTLLFKLTLAQIHVFFARYCRI